MSKNKMKKEELENVNIKKRQVRKKPESPKIEIIDVRVSDSDRRRAHRIIKLHNSRRGSKYIPNTAASDLYRMSSEEKAQGVGLAKTVQSAQYRSKHNNSKKKTRRKTG